MKVKVTKKNLGQKDYVGCETINKNIICVSDNIQKYDQVSINIELNKESNKSKNQLANVENTCKDNNKRSVLKNLWRIVKTPAEELATDKQDGAITVRALASTVMHCFAIVGYAFSIAIIPLMIFSIIDTFKNFPVNNFWESVYFIIGIIISVVVCVGSSISGFLLSKSLRVDAFKLEQNKDVSLVYNVAALIATILIGLLTVK